MHKEHIEKVKKKAAGLNQKQRAVVGLLLIGVIIAILLQVLSPKRSVESYCKVLKEENARLDAKPGDTYATSVFTEQSSDAHDFVVSLRNLEKVAPDEVRADVKTVRATFEKIEADPSQLLAAGFGSIAAENNLQDWNKAKCGIGQ